MEFFVFADVSNQLLELKQRRFGKGRPLHPLEIVSLIS
jgi:hypothetical protein